MPQRKWDRWEQQKQAANKNMEETVSKQGDSFKNQMQDTVLSPSNFDQQVEEKVEDKVKELEERLGEENKALQEKLVEAQKDSVVMIPIKSLQKNKLNTFNPIKGEKWEDFKASIREKGILTPIIVRKLEGDIYEIIAGHNRVNAASEVGLKEVPAFVKELDDVEASVMLAMTNLQRETTTDLEWGWAYRRTYEMLEQASGRKQEGEEAKGKTRDRVAQMYGVGKTTISNKIRLTYVIDKLHNNKAFQKLNLKIKAQLSYLTEEEQDTVSMTNLKSLANLTEEKARVLRELSKSEELEKGKIIEVIESELLEKERQQLLKEKEKTTTTVKLEIENHIVPEGIKPKEYVELAIKYIADNEIELI